jgi:hypothetical protein
MTLFCSVFLIVGLGSTIAMIGMSLDYIETEGVVLDRKTWSDPDTWGYAYKIQFVEQQTGTQLIANVSLGNGQYYDIGKRLRILYPPKIFTLIRPGVGWVVHDGTVTNGVVVVKDLITFYFIPFGLTVVGGIGTFGFLILFIRSFRKTRLYLISS